MTMEELIQAIVKALGTPASLDDIHDAIIKRGWSEADAFLAMKAAEILYADIVKLEEEKRKNAVFRRV